MPRLAANLTMLFTEFPFLDRFERAARAGFRGVEFLFPYAYRPQDIRARLEQFGLQLVLHNLPAGDWDAGERGIACRPDRSAEFGEGVERAIDYAGALGVKQLNCLVGRTPDDVPAAQAHETLVDNLYRASQRLKDAGLKLLVEPINRFDIPGFHLHRTDQALALIDEVGGGNLFLQYDVYHAQRTEGELSETLRRHLPRIAHVQVADNPGRNEPGSGEINFPFLLGHLDRIGYQGWIGCEYKPAVSTEIGLDWIQRIAK
ncbi:MAG: hydroxypyruvate isomerase [Burkholderiales bacterium]|nr:hydroxypyruvate isomerase [Burkholderiales bacterium]